MHEPWEMKHLMNTAIILEVLDKHLDEIAGVNGAGKTTQLQIITGSLEADSGEILKQKANMKIAYLTQEFDVQPSRTVRVCSSRLSCQIESVPYPIFLYGTRNLSSALPNFA